MGGRWAVSQKRIIIEIFDNFANFSLVSRKIYPSIYLVSIPIYHRLFASSKFGQRRLVVKNQLRALSQSQTAVMTADTFLHNLSDALLVVTNKTLKYSGLEGGGRKGIYLRPHGCSPGKFTLIIDPPGRESAERS